MATSHHANIVTPTRFTLYFVGRTAEEAVLSTLYFDEQDEANDHIADEGLDERGYKLFSFWVYPDPDSAEECV